MMGVEPLTPGAQTIKIHPKIGEIKSAALKTSFITGAVTVACNQTDKSYALEVEIPGGVKGDLLIPATKGNKKLYINGALSEQSEKRGSFHLKNFPAGRHILEVK
jgi:HSP20 family molecular chaperone IbpA